MGSGSLPRAGAVVLGSRGCRAGRSARPGHANGPATRTRSARRPMSTLPRRLPRLVPLAGVLAALGSGTSPTAKDNRFDTSKCQLAQMTKVGDSCTVKFPKAGTYPFFCEVHFALGMTGTIQVGKAVGGPTATTAAA